MACALPGNADAWPNDLQQSDRADRTGHLRILMSSLWISTARRTAAFAAVVLCAGAASACYVYQPSTSSLLAPGKSIALDLNDLGRLNLANQIGPEVKRIAGVLVSQTNNDYVLRVSQISFFNGRTSEWSGEAVNVRGDYVSGVYEEK